MLEQPDGETLDPTDWEAFRALGHRMVDDMTAYLRDVGTRPVWKAPSAAARAHLDAALPMEGQPAESVYRDFRQNVLPYPTGNIHPRFWGWVMGTGTPTGMLAEMLAAGMNANVSGIDDAANLVEEQVLEWLREMLGFPEGTSGVLVSGGSMANLVGLAVARNARAGFDVRAQGVAAAPARPVMYASREVHNSVVKAVELLGLGRDALRLVPVTPEYEMDVAALERLIAADRAAGVAPLAVIANAGAVNTGAIDPIDRIADVCARENLWLHVDGAFGAWAAIAPRAGARLRGLGRADSLGFDLHKWGYFPLEVACTLVRRKEDHHATFATAATYLAVAEGGLAARRHRFSDYGLQLSRGFRALKVWMGMKEHGVAKLGRLVQQNIDQAAYLADKVRAHAELELMAPVPLNVVCFRFVGAPDGGADLDAVNRRLLVRLHEDGIAAPSFTILEGRYALRVAITNHRSRREDFDALVEAALRLGRAIAKTGAAAAARG